MSSIKQLLQKARALIEDPAHWTQGALARDSAGNEVFPNSPQAVCFCAEGALACAFEGTFDLKERAGRYLDIETEKPLWTFNDSHTHEEVLNAFDKAIANCG